MRLSLFHISLRARAIIAIAGFGLLAFAVFFFLAASHQHQLLEEEVRYSYANAARILAGALAEAAANRNVSAMNGIFATARRDSDIVALVVRDHQADVIAQWFEPKVEKLAPQTLPFDPDASSRFFEFGGEPSGIFHQSGHLYVINAPITKAASAIGWLQICILTKRLNQALADSTYWGLRVLAAYFLLGTLVIMFIDWRLRQSVSALIETASAMAAGDLSRKVQLKTGDAIEKLGDQFNKMATALRERNQQVQNYQRNLEKMVAERTKTVRQERNKLRAILDHIPSGFLLLDKNLGVVTTSENFKKIHSRFGSNATHTRCGHGLWPVNDCTECPSMQAIHQDRVVSSTFALHSVAGDMYILEQTAIPIHRNGKIEGVLEMVTDVTERVETQKKMLKAERLAAAGEISAIIAHEARNSLTSIKMILQMLREKSIKNAKALRSTNVALDSVGHLESIVNELLQFARPAPLVRRPCFLPNLLDDVIELLITELTSRKIEVILNVDKKLPPIDVDATRIKEAVINLLINAADSIDKNGKIAITLERKLLQKEICDQFVFLPQALDEKGEPVSEDLKDIVIPCGAEVISLTIEDTGVGIPPEIVSHIFEPFVTTKTKGTGLGLPLVRRTANEHGGTVLYSPASGSGACFEMILPVSE